MYKRQDSACIIPSVHISEENLNTIEEYTRKIAVEMNVKGLMNMQYAIENGKVYVLEANPRASRTVPLVSKVCGIRMVPLATDIITSELTGRPSPVPGLKEREIPYYGVKEAAFPFNMFPEVDPLLGPEMRSTGEVLGISRSYGEAFYKAQEDVYKRQSLNGAWTETGPPLSPATAPCGTAVLFPAWNCSWRPAAPIRSGCTWPLSAILCWVIPCIIPTPPTPSDARHFTPGS